MNGFRSIYSSKKSMGGVSEREGALDIVRLIERGGVKGLDEREHYGG